MRDRLGIEDADVGDRTGLQRAAVLKAELDAPSHDVAFRMASSHAMMPRSRTNRPKNSGKHPQVRGCCIAQRRAVVRSDADQRIAHDRDDIVVVHPVLHDHGAGILRDERADRGERIERSRGSDVGDRATDRRGVGVRDDHGVLCGRRPPAARRQLPTERLRVGTSRLELLDASFRRLRREQRDEERRARGVRVLIPAHVDAFALGRDGGCRAAGCSSPCSRGRTPCSARPALSHRSDGRCRAPPPAPRRVVRLRRVCGSRTDVPTWPRSWRSPRSHRCPRTSPERRSSRSTGPRRPRGTLLRPARTSCPAPRPRDRGACRSR